MRNPAGPEKYISSFLRYADTSIFEFVLVFIADGLYPTDSFFNTVKRDNIQTEYIRAGSMFDFFKITSKLVHLLKKHQVHILHTHEYKSDLIGLIASKLTDIVLITSAHGWLKKPLKLKCYEALDAWALRFFNQILVGSRAMEEELTRKRIPAAKMRLVYNAVDISQIAANASGERIRKEFNIEKGTSVVGTIGRLSLEKGHHFFLQAASKVIRVRPQTKILIAGSGPSREEIESTAHKLGFGTDVILTGFYPDLNQFLAGLDVFVLSSLTESLPLALLEAMSAGKPVVATAVGEIPRIVEQNKTGIIVPPANSSQMAEAILSLLENRNEAVNMGKRGCQMVTEKFSAQNMSRQIENVYIELMRKSLKRPLSH